MKNKDFRPFKEVPTNIEIQGDHADLRKFRSNPKVLLKEISTKSVFRTSNLESISAIADSVQEYRRRVKELDPELYQHMPEVHMVIGKNEQDQNTLYQVVDRISGKLLDERNIDEPTKKELLRLVKKILAVYFGTFNGSDGQIMHIEDPDDWMIGINLNKPDQSVRIFMVDSMTIFHSSPEEVLEDIGYVVENFALDEDFF